MVRISAPRPKHRPPQRQPRRALRRHGVQRQFGGRLVKPGAVLDLAQAAVGLGGVGANGRGQQAAVLRALQQGDVAQVGAQPGVAFAVGQHQKLHCKLNVHHAACAVFDVKQAGLVAVGGAYFGAHGGNFVVQQISRLEV